MKAYCSVGEAVRLMVSLQIEVLKRPYLCLNVSFISALKMGKVWD